METVSMLKSKEYKNPLEEQKHISNALTYISYFHGEGKRLFFTVSAFDKKKNEVVHSHENAREFCGFEKIEGNWFLKFMGEENPHYEPISKIVTSSQIQNVREENSNNNS